MPSMTVAENIFLGREPLTRLGFIDDRALWPQDIRAARPRSTSISIQTTASAISRIAQRQMVEIARAVSYEAHVLIMDEPTSTLSEREVAQLFRIVDGLRARGSAIIYITHKIDEVFRIADEVTVMRDGRVVGSAARERARSRSAHHDDGRPRADAAVPERQRAHRSRGALGEGPLARRHVLGRVVRRAGGGDSRRCRARRIEAHRARGNDLRREARDVRRHPHRRRAGRHRFARRGDRSRDGVPHRGSKDQRAVPAAQRAREHGGGSARRRVRQQRLRQAGEAARRVPRRRQPPCA